LPYGKQPVEFRLVKPGYLPATIAVVPDSDQPAVATLAKAAATAAPVSPEGRARSSKKKVLNAIPIDPFAQ
jgi:hypothetical protein